MLLKFNILGHSRLSYVYTWYIQCVWVIFLWTFNVQTISCVIVFPCFNLKRQDSSRVKEKYKTKKIQGSRHSKINEKKKERMNKMQKQTKSTRYPPKFNQTTSKVIRFLVTLDFNWCACNVWHDKREKTSETWIINFELYKVNKIDKDQNHVLKRSKGVSRSFQKLLSSK